MRSSNLLSIAEGVHVWRPQPSAGWGLANCGLIVSAAHRTAGWLDCPYDRAMAEEFHARGRSLSGDAQVEFLLATHGNGDHLWGADVLPGARVIYTAETAGHIAHEPDPVQLHALVHNSDPNTVLGWYMRQHFGRYDWSMTTLPEPFLTFRGELELLIGDIPVQLTQLAPAHTEGDLMAYLPKQNVVFAGDVIFASSAEEPGDHPVHWSGPLEGIIEGCERVLATGATTIVPGHGPLLDRAGVQEHISYLAYLRERAHSMHDQGVGVGDAARRIIAEARYPHLHLPERLIITLGAEYRHLNHGPVPPMLDQVSDMAHLAWEIAHPGLPRPRTEQSSVPTSGTPLPTMIRERSV